MKVEEVEQEFRREISRTITKYIHDLPLDKMESYILKLLKSLET